MHIECADEGHVHGHGLYYGPFVPKAKLEAVVREAPPSAVASGGSPGIENG
jgi:hypothetical protein